MRALAALALFALGGCANFSPDNETIVRELHEEELRGAWTLFSGSLLVGGCRVSNIEQIKGCLVYSGERCYYASPGCNEDSEWLLRHSPAPPSSSTP